MDTDDPEEMSSEDEAQDIEYRCTICDFKTDSPRIFSAHEQSHREQPTTLYECALCSVKFTLLENLNKHYIRVHNQKIDNPGRLLRGGLHRGMSRNFQGGSKFLSSENK